MANEFCHCIKLRRASSAITKVYDKYLEPSGLRVGQYSLLRRIRHLAPVSVSDLAIQSHLDRTTLVRDLKPLEEKGFILDISKEGTRNRQLVLTEYGLEKLKYAESLWNEAQDYVKQALGESGLATLSALLLKVEKL